MPQDAKESKDFENSGDEKRPFDVESDDTILADDVKMPPACASIGWDNETPLASDDKSTGFSSARDATSTIAESKTSKTKRRGRRCKGSETAPPGGEQRNPKNRYFEEGDASIDILEIPDLEEEEREPDITTLVAKAPRNTTRAVQSLNQLDDVLKFALPSAQTHGIDLHLLTSVLCPESAVLEDDDMWNFDTLLNDIAQEIQKDLDDKEEVGRLTAQESIDP